MNLDQFMKELRADVDSFESEWRKGHKRDPQMYPMQMDDDNSGAWFEQFMSHLSMRSKIAS